MNANVQRFSVLINCTIHAMLTAGTRKRFFSFLLQRHTDWNAAATLLKGLFLTLSKFPYIAHLPHLKLVVQVCQVWRTYKQLKLIHINYEQSNLEISSFQIALFQLYHLLVNYTHYMNFFSVMFIINCLINYYIIFMYPRISEPSFGRTLGWGWRR